MNDTQNTSEKQTLPILTGKEQKQHIHRAITFFHPDPGEVFEIRALGPHTPKSKLWQGYAGGKKPIISGYFDDPVKATEAAAALDAIGCSGIYLTLNPVNRALLARANKRFKVAGEGETSKDNDVSLLGWLLIDIDVNRPAGISTTDEEHQAALDRAEWLKRVLTRKAWPDPLYGDSGNGAHLVYRLPDLERNDENVKLLKAALNALNSLYAIARPGNDGAYIALNIDCTVFNAARISKLYGTWARKGDDTPERPHRQARILSSPDDPQPVSIELFHALIAEAPKEEQQPARAGSSTSRAAGGKFDLAGYFDEYGIKIKRVKQHGGATLYILDACIFDPSHTGGESAIGQKTEGKLFYQCFHNSCKGRTWTDARQIISGSDHLGKFTEGYQPSKGPGSRAAAKDIRAIEAEEEEEAAWNQAQELFPRVPVPWRVLPPGIADSLQQLARSCASSALHMVGVALAILASALGRALAVSPKKSWQEPAILWIGDIRPSGEGKTPSGRQLLKIIEEAQFIEHKRYKGEMEEYQKALDQWNALPNKEKQDAPKPRPPRKERGYMVTNFTLEGVHADLDEHSTGGIIVCQDELSGFLSGQNQYKQKGNDRESWLCLHDGNSARIKRKSETLMIRGGRVSIFGGIQPPVFRKAFTGDEGVYLEDGTAFRFLFTYEPASHHPLNGESWTEENREKWENLLRAALDWAAEQIDEETGCIESPFTCLLDSDAQKRFFDWRNSIDQQKPTLPLALRGFLPKAYGYALRLAGLIHALWRLHQNETPSKLFALGDINRGIEMAEFYLGQTVDAMRLIEDADHHPPDTSERIRHLAGVLEALRGEVDSGRLAVGYILDRFNADLPHEKQVRTPKAMGAILRSIPLTLAEGLHDFRGKRRVSCLEWDEKIETFLVQSLHCLQSTAEQGFEDGDIEKTKSPKSPSTFDEHCMETLETSEIQSLHTGDRASTGFGDNGDFGDVISGDSEILSSKEKEIEMEVGEI